MIDTLQARIALLVSGKTLRELAGEWNCSHVTLWRAIHNQHCGPVANELRRRWALFISEHKPINNHNTR